MRERKYSLLFVEMDSIWDRLWLSAICLGFGPFCFKVAFNARFPHLKLNDGTKLNNLERKYSFTHWLRHICFSLQEFFSSSLLWHWSLTMGDAKMKMTRQGIVYRYSYTMQKETDCGKLIWPMRMSNVHPPMEFSSF